MEENLINELPDEIRVGIFDVARDLLKTDQVQVRVEPGAKKGDNYMGMVYRINYGIKDDSYKYNLFIKVAPSNEDKRETFNSRGLFLREIHMYDVIFPYFHEFQKLRGVNKQDGFYEIPTFYKSISTEPFECLMFHDLALEEFTMIDKSDVTVEHVLLVMKALGKFHALSFAIKDQEPEKFSEMVSELDEMLFMRGLSTKFSSYINFSATIALKCITDDKDAHLLKALLDLYEKNQYDQIAELCNGNESEPYSVITHGDIWTNNTMFQYDEEEILRNICLIDFQTVRYGSPVLDLTFYLFTSTTRDLRGRYYNIYLKTYHESLSNLLSRLGSDPEKVFPYSALQEQLQKCGKFGLLCAAYLLPIVLHEIDMAVEGVPEKEAGSEEIELSDGYKKRFRDVISDCYRLGYF